MLHQILTVESETLQLDLPAEFVGKQVEIIAFVVKKPAKIKKRIYPARPIKKTFSALQLDTRGFKFNREEANER